MEEYKKICWKITTRCNQNCKYCYGFSNINELGFEENMKVLNNIIEQGITKITWTGGEAILYPYFLELLKISKERGIINQLVTNGIYLANNYNEEIIDNLDYLTLSIDSISNGTNKELGKENNHFDIIKKVLENSKDKDIKIRINTVVSNKNFDKLQELGEFLNQYKIDIWKFFKFMPIRERALKNKENFELSERLVINTISNLTQFENINKMYYKNQEEFEKSLVILPNADIIKTHNGVDYKLGNLLQTDEDGFSWKKAQNVLKNMLYNSNEFEERYIRAI